MNLVLFNPATRSQNALLGASDIPQDIYQMENLLTKNLGAIRLLMVFCGCMTLIGYGLHFFVKYINPYEEHDYIDLSTEKISHWPPTVIWGLNSALLIIPFHWTTQKYLFWLRLILMVLSGLFAMMMAAIFIALFFRGRQTWNIVPMAALYGAINLLAPIVLVQNQRLLTKRT